MGNNWSRFFQDLGPYGSAKVALALSGAVVAHGYGFQSEFGVLGRIVLDPWGTLYLAGDLAAAIVITSMFRALIFVHLDTALLWVRGTWNKLRNRPNLEYVDSLPKGQQIFWDILGTITIFSWIYATQLVIYVLVMAIFWTLLSKFASKIVAPLQRAPDDADGLARLSRSKANTALVLVAVLYSSYLIGESRADELKGGKPARVVTAEGTNQWTIIMSFGDKVLFYDPLVDVSFVVPLASILLLSSNIDDEEQRANAEDFNQEGG